MQPQKSVCLFCLRPNDHESVDCFVYRTIGDRMKLLNARKTCSRCLTPGHIPSKCKNVVPCDRCRRLSHHKAVCWKNNVIKDVVLNPELERCVLCWGHNETSRCRLFETHDERKLVMEAIERCQKCLEMHPDQPCDAPDVSCVFCKNVDHHKAFCKMNGHLKENQIPDPAYSSCLFCAQHKYTTHCFKVKLLSHRRQILLNQKRCLKCLRLHPSVECRHRCRICRSSEHHAVLCSSNPQIIDDKPAVTTIETAVLQESLSPSSTSLSENSTSDSSEISNIGYRTTKPLRCSPSFFEFIMNLQLPQPCVQWTI